VVELTGSVITARPLPPPQAASIKQPITNQQPAGRRQFGARF
jgi:hypothetical protein